MSSRVVAIRCFAEETAKGWEAHCVDLGLTVEGESLESVKTELDELIQHHMHDASTPRAGSARGASPRRLLELRLRYWGLFLAGRLGLRNDALRRTRPQRTQPFAPRPSARSVR